MKSQDYSGIAALVLVRTPAAKSVMMFIAAMLDKSSAEFNSLAIERYTRLCHKTVSSACIALRKIGVLSWKRGYGRSPNTYQLDRQRMVELVGQQTHRL